MRAPPGRSWPTSRSPWLDVGAPGHVAISYLGKAAGRSGFDGYITETFDALSSRGGRVLFWSAAVDDPAGPSLDFGEKARATDWASTT